MPNTRLGRTSALLANSRDKKKSPSSIKCKREVRTGFSTADRSSFRHARLLLPSEVSGNHFLYFQNHYNLGRHKALNFVGGEVSGHTNTVKSKGNLASHTRRPIQHYNIYRHPSFTNHAATTKISHLLCEKTYLKPRVDWILFTNDLYTKMCERNGRKTPIKKSYKKTRKNPSLGAFPSPLLRCVNRYLLNFLKFYFYLFIFFFLISIIFTLFVHLDRVCRTPNKTGECGTRFF